MKIKLQNSKREPLEDTVRILVREHSTRKLVAEHVIEGPKTLEIEGLVPTKLYHVRAFPSRHRPIASFARDSSKLTLHAPVRPEKVRRIHIYRLGELEGMIANISELEREQVAGAMNIWAKMEATIVGGRSVAELVKKITRINQDRIWFEPNVDLLAAVSDSTTGADFRRASATLHALPGYRLLESFKTEELYGNLQLTFLESKDRPGDILVDADIDEASGVMHLFQVLRNTLTKGETHPYDIHEILEFHQELDTGYQLIV